MFACTVEEMQTSRSSRGMRERKKGPAVACVQAYVPPDLALDLHVRAAIERQSVSSLVTRALASYLERRTPAEVG
jgi:hypothetical protein